MRHQVKHSGQGHVFTLPETIRKLFSFFCVHWYLTTKSQDDNQIPRPEPVLSPSVLVRASWLTNIALDVLRIQLL